MASLKETLQLGCVSHDSSQRKSILREDETLESNHTVKFSKATKRRVKIRETKGALQGIIQKCEPQERNPWAPKFEESTQDETLKQERCVRRGAWELAKVVYSPAEAWVMQAPSSEWESDLLQNREFRSI